ncbi:MAG: DegT/DnrJ/EryC1/StrS family aminotransferase [Smithellaceae bacterium]|nr:DegT/DnrJ/EryC1/StrS family aminotransferase [Smithellaceae bacterium]
MPGYELMGKEEMQEVMEVMETGVLMRYGFDKERRGVYKVREFEESFARYCNARYALAVSSGSTALKVALTAMDIGPGDEVIVSAFTFLATYEAVLEVGAIPIMADIDETLNLDPADIANKMTPRTKAVIPVHMCGAPASIDKIIAVCAAKGLLVLEDNAQAAGGTFQGKKLGTFGDMGIFSFDYVKTMTAGEGGIVLSNRKELYLRAEWYHDHGHDHNPNVSRALEGRTILGFNYRMSELQGAVGLAQLRKLDNFIGIQRRNRDLISEALREVPGLKFRAMADPAGDTATFLGFNFPAEKTAKTFQEALGSRGVDAVCFKHNLWHYVPNWEHFLARATPNSKQYPFTDPSYKGRVEYRREDIPHAEDLLGRTLFMAIPLKLSEERLGVIRGAIEAAATEI